MKIEFHTASDSRYVLDVEAQTLTRSNPRNNIVAAAEAGQPPFEGPVWHVTFALFLPVPTPMGMSMQGRFKVEGRNDFLVTTGITEMGGTD